ncbi:androgen-induced gene 1 protein-like [Cylas formicarius]|uniref:androgen-induced gene 1 protein-like n=1 Tax=Cylas formicarius TaxID=197179 RepID=UPI002958908D|nr:androgen-induced gene 1 protein-like [Cylas formicarius]
MSAQKIVHLIIALHFWYSCYYDWYYVKIPTEIHNMGDSFLKSGKLKFLTYWDALLQSVFFTLCFLDDIVSGTSESLPKKTPLVRKIKDIMLPSLAFPLSMFVGLTFWGLYALDRELIFPKVLDDYFPNWLNHVMHTNIMIFTLLELVTSYRTYPSRKVGLTLLLSFMASYLVWIHVLNAYTNHWVYPILDVLNFPARIVFFISNIVIVVVLYVMGEKINSLRWGSRKLKIKNK